MKEELMVSWYLSTCHSARAYLITDHGKEKGHRCSACKELCEVVRVARPAISIPNNFKAAS